MNSSGLSFLTGADSGRWAAEEPSDLSDLAGVESATATALDAAGFDAGDVADGRVSYRELLDAGVDPAAAERLRHEYSLVWSFYWRPGADLRLRAERVRGLTDAERTWVVASLRDWTPDAGDADSDECPRCGDRMVTYTFGDREATECESCGYAGLGLEHVAPPDFGADRAESWEDALRRFRNGT